ncbi:MAG: transferrin-binding protein-like solute binding protein [Cardiobacteriaceae bacterium]|nr:transferrin-binding protein-like solute binding protein [Cardiobacteriaceae bacterium]
MKTTICFSQSAVLLLGGILTGCGGGGSDNGTSPMDPPPAVANIPGNNAGNSITGAYRGLAVVVPTLSTINANTQTLNVGGNDLNVLHVNNQALNLRPVNENGAVITKNIRSSNGKSYEVFIVSNFDYNNSRYGYIKKGNEDFIFTQGVLTTNMPSSGVAKYSGHAAVVHHGEADDAIADFTSDFAARTLEGVIKPDDEQTFSPSSIHAKINGNSFATPSGASVSSAGYFYGDNAHELGGIFSDTSQQLSGSFGAIRQ